MLKKIVHVKCSLSMTCFPPSRVRNPNGRVPRLVGLELLCLLVPDRSPPFRGASVNCYVSFASVQTLLLVLLTGFCPALGRCRDESAAASFMASFLCGTNAFAGVDFRKMLNPSASRGKFLLPQGRSRSAVWGRMHFPVVLGHFPVLATLGSCRGLDRLDL